MLEYDGVKMTQTNAICRYLAKTHGLAGDNPLDDYLIDTVVDQVNDLFEGDPTFLESDTSFINHYNAVQWLVSSSTVK